MSGAVLRSGLILFSGTGQRTVFKILYGRDFDF
jgi:hypothetical protein